MTTTEHFEVALRKLPRPGGRQLDFLRVHYKARGRAETVSNLAAAVRYKDYRGINLWYGRLARVIGEALGKKNATSTLLVDFVCPRAVTNREWVLVMRPEFAAALKRVGWV